MANTKSKPTKGKPISSHPLFPAVVALWFGALFGLGSLAIRPALIEGAVLKTGLDWLIPAAAPPLGVTARILIALIMASLGAAIGAALAVGLTRPRAVVPKRKRTAANPCADEEPGEALNGLGLLAGRRRALAAKDEERPSEPHDLAPLPGGDTQIFDVSATMLTPVAGLDPGADAPTAEAPLDLSFFPASAPVALQLPSDEMPALLAEREAPAMSEPAQIVGTPVSEDRVPAPQPEPAPVAADPLAASALGSAPADLDMVDLARRLQESMARRRAARAEAAQLSEAESVEPQASSAGAEEPAPIEVAVAEAIIAEEPAPPAETEAEPDMPDEDAFASLLSIDSSRQDSVRVEETEEPVARIEPVVIFPGQMACATVAPLRPLAASAATAPEALDGAAPAAPAIDPEEAEQALRLALANLQRISGAA